MKKQDALDTLRSRELFKDVFKKTVEKVFHDWRLKRGKYRPRVPMSRRNKNYISDFFSEQRKEAVRQLVTKYIHKTLLLQAESGKNIEVPHRQHQRKPIIR